MALLGAEKAVLGGLWCCFFQESDCGIEYLKADYTSGFIKLYVHSRGELYK